MLDLSDSFEWVDGQVDSTPAMESLMKNDGTGRFLPFPFWGPANSQRQTVKLPGSVCLHRFLESMV